MKKRKVSPEPAQPPPEEVKRIKKDEQEEEDKEEKDEEVVDKDKEEGGELRCEQCGILFSQPGTYSAHRQYYCQNRRRDDPAH